MISLQNALEPSSCAAALVGPKQRMPAAVSASARPATSGASGPITTRSTRSWTAADTSRGMSSAPMSISRASRAMPGVPGRAQDLGAAGRARQCMDERVLAAAAADDQDPRR